MYLMSIMNLLIICLSTVIMLLPTLLSKTPIEDREKSSPFEGGFDLKSSAPLPFSLQILFNGRNLLKFRCWNCPPLPMTIIMNISHINSWIIISLTFFMILLIGLYHEWNQGSLEWAS